ncbi:hypothetical protein F4780DRAFT_784185 [Xylariomycetidae sp. FL0641]|nr:hypothetical protein F4780DRAFT_784185 [Xylariomycetidae sp. FL0641]
MPPLARISLLRGSTATTTSNATAAMTRLLSTSAARSDAPRIPPESPRFINVPNPPQDQSIEARRELKPVKGFLPATRRIFQHRDAHRKPTPEYLAKAAPAPTSARSQREARGELQAWKRTQAASRRANLAAGMTSLWARHQRTTTARRDRAKRNWAANWAATTAPEREDERLTRGDVHPGTLQTAVERDPERLARALESRERTDARRAAQSEARRDAVQELYMSARNFIVREDQLEARVNELFTDNYYHDMGKTSVGRPVTNIWDLQGPPPTVADMLNEVTRASSGLMKNLELEAARTMKRQKVVAEELTGGKMDIDKRSS